MTTSALTLLLGVATTSERVASGLREHVVSCAIDVALKLQKLDDIERLLSQIPAETISPIGITILKAQLALTRGQLDVATILSNELLEAISSGASSDDRRNLALLLSKLGRQEEALPLWQGLAPTTVLTPDTRHLLDCALRLGHQGLALDVCKI